MALQTRRQNSSKMQKL